MLEKIMIECLCNDCFGYLSVFFKKKYDNIIN